MTQLFKSPPDGKLHIPNLWDLDRRLRRLQDHLAKVESELQEHRQAA